MTMRTVLRAIVGLFVLATASGCVTRPPTIAHVHLGHALTGVHVTPNRDGYLLVAGTRPKRLRRRQQAAAGKPRSTR